jgi:hypothetical protein
MSYMIKQSTKNYDLVVVGGGLAGFCAAVAAGRQGVKTCLVHDRPVFGGNSSSEIRVTVHGACQHHGYARETGILSELLIEERVKNHEPIFENGWVNSIWDIVLYDVACKTPNLDFYLNTSIIDVNKNKKNNIESIVGRVGNAETEIRFKGEIYIDCSGDGIVAALAGCEWFMGSESRDQFNEPHAPLQASSATMGNSIHIKARDMGYPVPFKLPSWAQEYHDPDFFYKSGRIPHDPRGGYWWIEIGVPWNTIYDNELIRHELTRHALGVWDWIKNKDEKLMEAAKNYGLDWIGQVPGKRESRRILGRYFLTERDLLEKTIFPDEVAYGGWFLDLHTPGGLLAEHSEPSSAEGYSKTSKYAAKSFVGPYGIPLRSLIAKGVNNLLMAGRCISVTHAALGSVRVQGTTALMGQAAGTAASVALELNIPLDRIAEEATAKVQQRLLRDGCFLPNYSNQDPKDLARTATASASSAEKVAGASLDHQDWYYEQLRAWDDKPEAWEPRPLERKLGQWIAIGEEKPEEISICLSNLSDSPQHIQAQLLTVENIWDYRTSGALEPCAEALLVVPAGGPHWINWHIDDNRSLPSNQFVRLDLLPNKNICWHVSKKFIPGHLAGFEFTPGKMRRLYHGLTLAYQILPVQSCFQPEHVLSGVSRPQRTTNLWRSDSHQELPQWLMLTWENLQTIKAVQITFPGYIEREYHAYPPLYRDPQCAAEYKIQVDIDGQWEDIVHCADNYHVLKQHELNHAVKTSRLRIIIYKTNGEACAGIYEVRCY